VQIFEEKTDFMQEGHFANLACQVAQQHPPETAETAAAKEALLAPSRLYKSTVRCRRIIMQKAGRSSRPQSLQSSF